MLDTSAVIDLPVIDEVTLPIRATITAVTLAELSQGPHLAATPHERSVRLERLADFDGLRGVLEIVAV